MSGTLSREKRNEFFVPNGGDWFSMAIPAYGRVDELAKTKKKEDICLIGWDTKNGAKAYGVYSSMKGVYEAITQNPADKRWGYEMVREGEPVKAYCDIDFEGKDDSIADVKNVSAADGMDVTAADLEKSKYPVLKQYLKLLRTRANALLQIDPEIYVSCGSRMKESGTFKNSYHITVANLVFKNNTDGAMAHLFKVEDPEIMKIVDTGVYTRNRLMRMPLCSKKGDMVPLARISGNPFDDDLHTKFADDSFETFELLALKPILDEDTVLITREMMGMLPAPQGLDVAVVGQKRSHSSTIGGAAQRVSTLAVDDRSSVIDTSVEMKNLPFPIALIKNLLVIAGDSVSIIKDTPYKYSREKMEWTVQCTKNQGVRKCLMCPQANETHQHNNCLLFVKNMDKGVLQVEYFCPAKECKSFRKPVIGTIVHNDRDFTWKAEPTPMPQPLSSPASSQVANQTPGQTASQLAQFQATQLEPQEDVEMQDGVQSDSSQNAPRGAGGGGGDPSDDDGNDSDNNGNDPDDNSDSGMGGGSGEDGEDGSDEMSVVTQDDDGYLNTFDVSSAICPFTDYQGEETWPDKEVVALNGYDQVKQRFEQHHFRLKNPHLYCRELPPDWRLIKDKKRMWVRTKGPQLYKTEEFINAFRHVEYWGPDKKGVIVKLPFVPAWMKDATARSYEKLETDPGNSGNSSSYNMWSDFIAEHLSPVSDHLVPDLVEPIINHIHKVICRSKQAHTDWFLNHSASMVQRPWKKTQVAIFLFGEQGCGKDIYYVFLMYRILGFHACNQTASPEHDVFAKFGNALVNRVLCLIDEVSSNVNADVDKLKNIVTNETNRYEQKGKDNISVTNFCNLVMTTNNVDAVKVSFDDRRLALFHCASVYKDNKAYFEALGNHMERPCVARAFYQMLMARPLPVAYDMQETRPKTEFYKDIQVTSLPPLPRFLSALVNEDGQQDQRIKTTMVYAMYRFFVIKMSLGSCKLKQNFTRDMNVYKDRDYFVKRHTRDGNVYDFKLTKLKAKLIDSNEYDVDANFPRGIHDVQDELD